MRASVMRIHRVGELAEATGEGGEVFVAMAAGDQVVFQCRDEHRGWTYAKYLLGHERTNIAAVGRSKRELAFIKRLATRMQKGGRPLLADAVYAHKVAALEADLMALEVTVLRVIYQEAKQRAPGPEASMLKVKGTEIQQRLTELMVEAAGPLGLPFDPAPLPTPGDNRAVYGGVMRSQSQGN